MYLFHFHGRKLEFPVGMIPDSKPFQSYTTFGPGHFLGVSEAKNSYNHRELDHVTIHMSGLLQLVGQE